MAKIDKYQATLLAGIVAIFLLLSCWHPDLPGLNFDECLGAAPAVNFLVGSKTEPMQINPSVVHIFGRPLPMMVMPYIGPIKTILHIPFYALFGISVVTTRLAPVFCVSLAILIFHLAIKRLEDERTALLSCLLMAVHPAMTIYATRDITPVAFAILMLAVIFYFLSYCLEGKKKRTGGTSVHLLSLSFLCGLGVSHKADFLFLAVSLALSIVLVYKIKLTLKEALLISVAFSLGALPMIIFNFSTGFMTLSVAKAEFKISDMPFAFFTRFFQLGDLFSTRTIMTYFTGSVSLFPLIVGLATIAIVILYFLDRRRLSRFNSFVVLSMGLFVALSSLTQFSIQFHHLLVITPLVCIFLAKSRWRYRRVGNTSLLLAFLLAGSSVESNLSLKKTGGVGVWSSAINKLNADLLRHGRVVNLRSHGFTNSLIVLSKGKLEMRRVYIGEEPDPNGLNLYRPGVRYTDDDSVKLYHDSQPRVFAVLTE